MNLDHIIGELETIRQQFSKVPNRLYSKNTINEKCGRLNKIIELYETIDITKNNNVEKKKCIEKLISDIKKYIQEQKEKKRNYG